MKLRIEGTETEIAAVLEHLAPVLDIQEVSRFYPNRGASVLGRVYVNVAAPTGRPVRHAKSERADTRPSLPNRKEIQ